MSDEAIGVSFEKEEFRDSMRGNGLAEDEVKVFGDKGTPNTAYISLWNGGYINFSPDSSVSVFALISLALLLVAIMIISLLSIFSNEGGWPDTAITALGHAIAAVIGAIVGAAANKSKSD